MTKYRTKYRLITGDKQTFEDKMNNLESKWLPSGSIVVTSLWNNLQYSILVSKTFKLEDTNE